MYIYKLVCGNGDRSQEVMGEDYQLSRDVVATMESTYQPVENVRNSR